MYTNPTHSLNRRGAALLVAIVLLALLSIVAGAMLPQILRARQENRMALLHTQTRQLLDDALRNVEAKRKAEPEFSGEILTLGSDCQPFPGTFQVTTQVENDTFAAKVEYRSEKGKLVYTMWNTIPQKEN